MKYLESLKILSARQHGFRPGHSTETGINACVQNIMKEMDKNTFLVSIMFELTRVIVSC